jgi:hypothetical protein
MMYDRFEEPCPLRLQYFLMILFCDAAAAAAAASAATAIDCSIPSLSAVLPTSLMQIGSLICVIMDHHMKLN